MSSLDFVDSFCKTWIQYHSISVGSGRLFNTTTSISVAARRQDDSNMAYEQAFRFLDLPAELRTCIYKETFAHLPPLSKYRCVAHYEPEKLLHVCRQVRSEVNAEYSKYLKAQMIKLEEAEEEIAAEEKRIHAILRDEWNQPFGFHLASLEISLDALLMDMAQVRTSMARVHKLQARSCERMSQELMQRMER